MSGVGEAPAGEVGAQVPPKSELGRSARKLVRSAFGSRVGGLLLLDLVFIALVGSYNSDFLRIENFRVIFDNMGLDAVVMVGTVLAARGRALRPVDRRRGRAQRHRGRQDARRHRAWGRWRPSSPASRRAAAAGKTQIYLRGFGQRPEGDRRRQDRGHASTATRSTRSSTASRCCTGGWPATTCPTPSWCRRSPSTRPTSRRS